VFCFVDESMRDGDRGLYLLAAVLVDANLDDARQQVASILLPRPVTPRLQDRARALCMTRLLWDARALEVADLVIESRQERNDKKDRRTILRALQAQGASPNLHYRFERPKAEPLLWLPDAVAGATATQLTEGGAYLDALGGLVTITELAP
jgi:hypothetical protein